VFDDEDLHARSNPVPVEKPGKHAGDAPAAASASPTPVYT
jgi:hypothetical protein